MNIITIHEHFNIGQHVIVISAVTSCKKKYTGIITYIEPFEYLGQNYETMEKGLVKTFRYTVRRDDNKQEVVTQHVNIILM